MVFSRLRGDWLLVRVLQGHLWLADTWHSSWDTHLSPKILLHMPLVPSEQTLLSLGGRNQVRLFLGQHLLHTPGADSFALLTNLCVRFKRQNQCLLQVIAPVLFSPSHFPIWHSQVIKSLLLEAGSFYLWPGSPGDTSCQEPVNNQPEDILSFFFLG